MRGGAEMRAINWQVMIGAERKRQDAKWGEQNHNDLKWLAILSEEMGKLAKEILEGGEQGLGRHGTGELVQVAAVAVAWLEALGRR